MTLAEVLVAGVIVSSSCCASLQVWSQTVQTTQAARDLVQTGELLELQWMLSRRWLAAVEVRCPVDSFALEVDLDEALPLEAGISRRLVMDHSLEGVWLTLEHNATGLLRRQLFTAAGSGWCRSSRETES
ncbi:hypothetical protein [Synechococcus sp. UW140]|uniref:hypothetical protein n=1 Tax=Synechococcus sp. UW140 TaxID=368503 RepID=UPI000E0F8243|nr:hypothetical protein [Synechococcus sp. UW140]